MKAGFKDVLYFQKRVAMAGAGFGRLRASNALGAIIRHEPLRNGTA